MIENTNKIGVLQKVGKTLQGFASFIMSPWLNQASLKPLKQRIEFLEQNVQRMPTKEEYQDRAMHDLQQQIDFLQASTNFRFENLINYKVRQKVLEVLKEQTYIINEFLKPIVEDVVRELETKKQFSQPNIRHVDIQKRQEQLRQSLARLDKLTASVSELEVQRHTCIEAGQWLLAQKVEIAKKMTDEFLIPQHSYRDEFHQTVCKYLKLLGCCMKNEIEPRLLYKRVITHKQVPTQMYLQAFEQIKNQYVHEWEVSNHISSQAADELRQYFSYLIDYLLTTLI